ncbi:MAG: S1 RNA-binding domain-containing protein [Planctomycetota bacterium]|nr:S1 RNA-binding domain-containing protein [Planctomycetota bacterium]
MIPTATTSCFTTTSLRSALERRGRTAARRREIGHGALARRALRPILPEDENFPYTIRVVSDILESNGSSSMATVCGGSLAMMDAGVPTKAAVAGIAMGLLKDGDEYHVLTDILGDEDHFGDMDFKVAGTRDGITALQMDIKITNIPTDVMKMALEKAHTARMHVLDKMDEVLAEPRPEISANAPQITMVQIPVDMIGKVIGPGGKVIRAIQEDTGATVEIDDDGKVTISAVGPEKLEAAKQRVKELTFVPEEGATYDGTVTSVRDFGAFVEIAPGVEGLLHVSEITDAFVKDTNSVVNAGDKIRVKVLSVDAGTGKMRLSRKAVIETEGGEDVLTERLKNVETGEPRQRGGDSGRGGRGGGRGGDRRGGGGRGGQGGGRRR